MLIYKRVSETDELVQILNLQRQNLPSNLSQEEKEKEGFVSVSHTFEILERMNSVCPHVVAKDQNKVVAYALCMHPDFSAEIELLKPMFNQISSILPESISFMAMGQVCIDSHYRKKGVFRNLYSYYKSQLKDDYNCLITAVATTNLRSLNAHKTIGFETLKTYQANAISWELMKWDWQK